MSIILDANMARGALECLYQLIKPESEGADNHVYTWKGLKELFESETGEILNTKGLKKYAIEDLSTDYVAALVEALVYSIDWNTLQSSHTALYFQARSTVEALSYIHASLAAREKQLTSKPKKKIPKKEANKLVQDFLNGEWITSLLVQKAGIRKDGITVSPETYGEYSPSRNEAVALLMEGDYYAYMPRESAILTWFASQIQSYANYLRGTATRGVQDDEYQYISDLLTGVINYSARSSEQDWAKGRTVQVTFTGINLPGVALRIDPVVFTEEEIQEFAAQIKELNKLAKRSKDISATPDVILFGEDIQVKLKAHRFSFSDSISYDKYDLSLLNLDRPAEDLVDQVKGVMAKEDKPNLISILFYGIPGSGKSQLANYIGKAVGKKVIKKTYADLQSMYVSEGEKQLQEAFQEAEMEDAILLIDELDSIAENRSQADRNYQKTFVNQLLTELDSFKGIFIATSNSMESLDPAVLRRLFLKLKFDFLNEEQAQKCFELYFPKLKRHKLGYIPYLTPGDFYAVSEAARYEKKRVTLKRVRELLQHEVDIKKKTLHEVIASERKVGYDAL